MSASKRPSVVDETNRTAFLSGHSMTVAAFLTAAVFAGGNAVAIKVSNAELAPFWGAAIRFLAASALLFGAVVLMRLNLPRGRALLGAFLYGLLNFGAAYGFIYWALIEVTAGTAMIVLALVPLLTLTIAVIVGIERFTARRVAGAVIAAAGIMVVFRDALSAVPPVSLAALLLGAVCISASPVVVKTFPRVHAISENAIGMLCGGLILFALSILSTEAWVIPVDGGTQAALLYLVIFGSAGLFLLYIFIVRRMTASGANYIMLLAPLSAVALGALILGETISPIFLIGGALVLTGVYIGAIK